MLYAGVIVRIEPVIVRNPLVIARGTSFIVRD